MILVCMITHGYAGDPELLANHPGCITGNPPVPICEIIENQNNTDINNGFYLKLYNRHSTFSRDSFQGGLVERKRAEPYIKASEVLYYEYPIISSIYMKLAKTYSGEALRQDIESEMMMLDN